MDMTMNVKLEVFMSFVVINTTAIFYRATMTVSWLLQLEAFAIE